MPSRHQQRRARTIGLLLALVTRILLVLSLSLNLRYQAVTTRRRRAKQSQTVDDPVHLRLTYVKSGAHGVTLPKSERKP